MIKLKHNVCLTYPIIPLKYINEKQIKINKIISNFKVVPILQSAKKNIDATNKFTPNIPVPKYENSRFKNLKKKLHLKFCRV